MSLAMRCLAPVEILANSTAARLLRDVSFISFAPLRQSPEFPRCRVHPAHLVYFLNFLANNGIHPNVLLSIHPGPRFFWIAHRVAPLRQYEGAIYLTIAHA